MPEKGTEVLMITEKSQMKTAGKSLFYQRQESLSLGYRSFSKEKDLHRSIKGNEKLEDKIDLSQKASKLLNEKISFPDYLKSGEVSFENNSDIAEPSVYLIKLILEKFTGRSINMGAYINGSIHGEFDSSQKSEIDRLQSNLSGSTEKIRTVRINESLQQIKFAAHGKVVTSSGDEFSFEIGFQMLSYQKSVSLNRDALNSDPLVINSGDFSKELAKDMKFLFDLDKEDFEGLKESGSGFLKWDRDSFLNRDSSTDLSFTENLKKIDFSGKMESFLENWNSENDFLSNFFESDFLDEDGVSYTAQYRFSWSYSYYSEEYLN